VLNGSAFVALFDLRAGSVTQRTCQTVAFDAATGLRGLYIPPGVAHGFLALSDMDLQYMVDRAFTGQDEFGIAWDDPDLGIGWPMAAPVLSARDRSNPSLAEVLRDPPGSPR
jgi:dTDP-4-dehydrorhamnose 3,5-epimerase